MKKKIRKQLLAKRKQLNILEVKNLSNLIAENIFSTKAFQDSEVIHLYYPINNEVDTRKIIEKTWENGKKVIMPRTDFQNHRIINYQVTSYSQLETTSFNMLEPIISQPVYDKDPDLVLVPGVAFDTRCNRMGYGGGFYDRFLSETDSFKIALCYNLQLLEELPTEDHDVKMDMIITEDKIMQRS